MKRLRQRTHLLELAQAAREHQATQVAQLTLLVRALLQRQP